MPASPTSFSRAAAILATCCALLLAPLATGCGSNDGGELGGNPAASLYSADAGVADPGSDVTPLPSPAGDDAGADASLAHDAATGHDGATPPDAAHDSGHPGNGCPIIAYPSGVHIQTKPNAARTAEYTSIADNGDYPLPKCFLDTDDLFDPVASTTYDLDVMVGKHFTLRELVGTELPYGHLMLLSEVLVAKLDGYREALAASVALTSGFRSPSHQRAVCRGLCGQDVCPGTCAERSRHSWGDAADHGVPPSQHYADAACTAQFNYVFREGDHMHLDLNPAHKICTVQIL